MAEEVKRGRYVTAVSVFLPNNLRKKHAGFVVTARELMHNTSTEVRKCTSGGAFVQDCSSQASMRFNVAWSIRLHCQGAVGGGLFVGWCFLKEHCVQEPAAAAAAAA